MSSLNVLRHSRRYWSRPWAELAALAVFVLGAGLFGVVAAGSWLAGLAAVALGGLLSLVVLQVSGAIRHELREIERLKVRVSALDDRVARGEKRNSERYDRVKRLIAQADAQAASAVERVQRLDDSVAEQDLRRRRRDELMGRNLERERRARLVAFAARDSHGHMPDRLLLQMTLNRTGSTRLFDMLRSHPSVYFEPLDFIWSALGLTGRRYPVGLSDLEGASTAVVAQQGLGVAVRSLSAGHPGMPDVPSGIVAIEKAHPQFFEFDTTSFVEKLRALRDDHGMTVDLIYQIRSPIDVMWSMAEYKQRDPRWQGPLTVSEIPAFVARAYESLGQLAAIEPGLIIDFDDLETDSPRLRDLGRLVDRSMTDGQIDAWLSRAFDLTRRESIGGTNFLGARGARSLDGPDGCWSDMSSVLTQSQDMYESLRARRG